MKKLYQNLEWVFVFLAAEGIQYIVVNTVVGLLRGILGALEEDVIYTASALAVLVCGIVFFYWYRILTGINIKKSCKGLTVPRNLLPIIGLGIGLQCFLTGGMNLLQPFFQKYFLQYEEVSKGLVSGNPVMVAVLIIVIAPVTEELIFRGVMLYKGIERFGFPAANLLQGIFFGIYHWNVVQGIAAVFAGCLFGLVYHRYRTITAPILLHMICNASAFLVSSLVYNRTSHILILLAGAVLSAGFLCMMKPYRETENFSVKEQ